MVGRLGEGGGCHSRGVLCHVIESCTSLGSSLVWGEDEGWGGGAALTGGGRGNEDSIVLFCCHDIDHPSNTQE